MGVAALLWSAATLGLVGGLHCVAMCTGLQRVAVHGAAPQAIRMHRIRRSAPWIPPRAEWRFQGARVLAYTALGAIAGSGSELLRWGASAQPAMRPLWTGLNLLILLIGLSLLVQGRQPQWLDGLGQGIRRWGHARLTPLLAGPPLRPWLTGMSWALLPCGLLYSALALAALASTPLHGALVMLVFALGTAAHLLLAQRLLAALPRLGLRTATLERWGVRLGGAMLAGLAIAALIAVALGQAHPFCGP